MTSPDGVFDLTQYHQPGVYSEAVPAPLIEVFTSGPRTVGLFGQARGYQVATESVTVPPDSGGTISTLTAPSVVNATNIYTADAYQNGASVTIDVGDVAETARTVTNVDAITTTLSSATNIGDATIKTPAQVGTGSTIAIDSGTSLETRTVLNSTGFATNLAASASNGATTLYIPVSIPNNSNIVLDAGGNVENRAVTNVSGGISTTLAGATTVNASQITTTASIPAGALIAIDVAPNVENRLVTASTPGINSTLSASVSSGATVLQTADIIPTGTVITIGGTGSESRTVSASTSGVSTTLAANASASATSISVNGAIPNGSTITIEPGTGNAETRTVSAVTGTGPYTLTVAALTNAHTSGVTVSTPNTVTVPAVTNAHTSGVTVTSQNTLTVAALSLSHAQGSAVTSFYALTVASLSFAHNAGATLVVPTMGPYTLTVSPLADAHAQNTSVFAPASLSLSAPLHYAHFTGATVTGAGSIPAPTRNLAQDGIDTSSLVVRDPVTGTTYLANIDYTVQNVTGPSDVFNGADSKRTITRILNGHIPPNKIVQCSYHYTNANYFNAKQFFTYNDVTDTYGPALDANGNIVSELSFGAGLAFLNGARRLVCAPCTNPGNVFSGDYQHALDQLKSDVTISVVVCCNGDQLLHDMVKIHVDLMSAEKAERRAILGLDGSVTPVPSSTRIAAAINMFDQRVAMVSPATVYYYNPINNKVQTIGGHWMACALAGLAVLQNPALPLTRKTINGFVGVAETYSETQKDIETQGGLMVVEHSNQGNMRVRHGVTTNFTSLFTREWTILGQQDAMVQLLRNFLDNDGLIGQVIDDLTLVNVRASTINGLQELTNSEVILGYRRVAVRQLTTNPDVVEVSFEWRPAIPLNYILLRFAVDISTGSIDTTGQLTSEGDTSITGPI